jgi:hypothetical protein
MAARGGASGAQGPLISIGAYRNLTATFLRYRDASRAHSRPFGAKGARCALPAAACCGTCERAQP